MEYLEALTKAINALVQVGQDRVMQVLRRLLDNKRYTETQDLIADAIWQLNPLFETTARNVASVTAQSYDLMRTASVGAPFGAQPYTARNVDQFRSALYGMANQHKDNMDAFLGAIIERLDYEAKRASGATMVQNGMRDPAKPKFARVPTGPETCPFCIMLASQGFVYHSERSAGGINHFHANCDCRIIPGFDGMRVDGYDPDVYLEQFRKDLEDGKLSKEKLNEASYRAKLKKRQAEAEIAAKRSDTNLDAIKKKLKGGYTPSFTAKNPDGSDANFYVSSLAYSGKWDDIKKNLGYGNGKEAEFVQELMKRSNGHSFKTVKQVNGYDFEAQDVRFKGVDGEMHRVRLTWSVKDGSSTLVGFDYLRAGAGH